ncbi:hypothetical protein ACQHIV_32075 [Kribbella sp. GL6]
MTGPVLLAPRPSAPATPAARSTSGGAASAAVYALLERLGLIGAGSRGRE